MAAREGPESLCSAQVVVEQDAVGASVTASFHEPDTDSGTGTLPTSKGVTMTSASVTPAMKPAAMRRLSASSPFCERAVGLRPGL